MLSGSVFVGNRGSVGGAVLSRSTNLRVVDAVIADDSATTWAESGQHGNGGGLHLDRMWLDDPVDLEIRRTSPSRRTTRTTTRPSSRDGRAR